MRKLKDLSKKISMFFFNNKKDLNYNQIKRP